VFHVERLADEAPPSIHMLVCFTWNVEPPGIHVKQGRHHR
jgi:hypothetical protein